MNYWKKLTAHAREETFNPLIWPSIIATFAYGLGFAVLLPLNAPVGRSSLFDAMNEIQMGLALFWGIVALATVFTGLFFLLYNQKAVGKIAGFAGFLLWTFASICYVMTDNWLVFWAVTFPNLWFWFWQYWSLTDFGKKTTTESSQ